MSPFTRKRIMTAKFGCTIKELEKAENSVKKIQKSRLKTKNEVIASRIAARKERLRQRQKRADEPLKGEETGIRIKRRLLPRISSYSSLI